MRNGHAARDRIHLLRPAPSLPDSPVKDHPSEIGTVRLEAKIEVMKAELDLWQERCAYKTAMLLDEAEWLQEKLDTSGEVKLCVQCYQKFAPESESRIAVRRRISRLRGAAFRYEKKDAGL